MPVYNAGGLFRPCVESVLGQTLRELELVLVLDCPTDGTAEEAESFARSDGRVRLVRNERNLHIGLSRNAGLAVAAGEYVGFADDDDLMEPDMYERMYARAEDMRADVVICHHSERRGSSDVPYPLPDRGDENVRRPVLDALVEARYALPATSSFRNVNSVWTELIRRSLIVGNGLLFPDNRRVSYEDALFNAGVFACAGRVALLPECLYHHLLHGANTFSRYEYKSPERIVAYVEEMERLLRRHGLMEEEREAFRSGAVRRLYTSMRNEIRFRGIGALPAFFRKVRSNETVRETLAGGMPAEVGLTKRVFARLCRG